MDGQDTSAPQLSLGRQWSTREKKKEQLKDQGSAAFRLTVFYLDVSVCTCAMLGRILYIAHVFLLHLRVRRSFTALEDIGSLLDIVRVFSLKPCY